MWSRWTDGVCPAYRKLAEQVTVTDSVKLHGYAAHLLSSQTFAFNLFLPFREGNRARLSERMSDLVGAKLSVDKVQFEWVPPGALLGELDGERPVGDEPATAVDIVLWSRLTDDQRAVVLIEVKLSESGFTKCRGPDHPKNDRKEVCESSGHFFTDPSACFIRGLPRKQRNRRYWEIFTASHGSVHAAFPGVDMNGSCPFAGHAYQPMRNLAIARSPPRTPEEPPTSKVKRRYHEALDKDNLNLPSGVPPIEIWKLDEEGPKQVVRSIPRRPSATQGESRRQPGDVS